MIMEPQTKKSKSLQYYMRAIHRVLGYLAVGMAIIYALSGITLIHRTGDFMKKTVPTELSLSPGLDAQQLGAELKIKNLKVTNETAEEIVWADGKYEKTTGNVTYDKKELIKPLDKFIDLHKLPDAKNPHIAFVTTLFGIVLLLLALTSLFMYKPSAKQFKANMIYIGIGVVITVILIIMV